MTPQDWNIALKPEVTNAEADVFLSTVVRANLNDLHAVRGDYLTTTGLVEYLYPLDYAVQSDEGVAARKRIFSRLMHLATHQLSDCATRGPRQRLGKYTKMGRPWQWHRPIEVPCCEKCGKPL